MLSSNRLFSVAADCSSMTAAPPSSFLVTSRVFYTGFFPDCIQGPGKSQGEGEGNNRALSQSFVETVHHLHGLILVTLCRRGKYPVISVIRKLNKQMLVRSRPLERIRLPFSQLNSVETPAILANEQYASAILPSLNLNITEVLSSAPVGERTDEATIDSGSPIYLSISITG